LSTRKGGVSPEPFGMNTSFKVGDDPEYVQLNRKRYLEALQLVESQLAIPSQVHGNTVQVAGEPGRYEACDGLLTRRPGLFLSVSVADCLPIFLFDPVREHVGLVHAGWKGTRLGILSHALRLLSAESTKPEEIIAWIGPGAGVCCYEVGEEVAREFEAAHVERVKGRRPHLDLKSANRAQLLAAGVREENIEISTLCTICNPDLLHSYRRDGTRSGRMTGIAGIR
jgi:purine-nucleoside/S-methyl-5'-thioadenosine phosphorylase / adenosine deaminase